MRVSPRALLVLILLLVAVGVPAGSWFVSGSKEAERESQRVIDEARAEARTRARSAAEQLGARLEKIRVAESQRPYFHYQNLMHDPRGASQGLSVVPSPLATGPSEPLILTHFQIDAKGKVTLPTINDDVVELNAPDIGREHGLRTEIAAVAPQLLRQGEPALAELQAQVEKAATARKEAQPKPETRQAAVASPAPAALKVAATPVPPSPQAAEVKKPEPDPWAVLQQTPQVRITDTAIGGSDASQSRLPPAQLNANRSQNSSLITSNNFSIDGQALNVPSPAPPTTKDGSTQRAVKIDKVDPNTFAQNQQSNVVFQELKSAEPPKSTPRSKLPPKRAPDVEIATRDFDWSSVDIGGTRALAALRPVVTPDGAVVQGFVVNRAALGETLRTAGHLNPGAGAFPLGATGWSLDADEQAATLSGMTQAAGIRRAFRQTFYAGLGAAGLALLAVAFLVWRTERLARERAQFAAAAAHELRTPLAGLRLYGDMLAHQLGNPERSRIYAQHVSEEADRLGRVVANMLEFTRLERGSLTIKPEPGDLGGAVRECVEQLRPALEVAGCNVTLSIADDLPSLAFDRDAVHHIVQNLLDNAEKYSRPSGEQAPSERSVHVEVTRVNGSAAVTVSDRGVGIDPRTARHLFAPFERGSTSDAPAGLGLGLVLVKALARAHGGEVSWAARSGGGTTFRVLIPLGV
jgi:signal transduction histidine kinase